VGGPSSVGRGSDRCCEGSGRCREGFGGRIGGSGGGVGGRVDGVDRGGGVNVNYGGPRYGADWY
jgi:hypothetical protein